MIFYVEDDDSIRELVVYTLGQMGMPIQGFPCADPFWHEISIQKPDLILSHYYPSQSAFSQKPYGSFLRYSIQHEIHFR